MSRGRVSAAYEYAAPYDVYVASVFIIMLPMKVHSAIGDLKKDDRSIQKRKKADVGKEILQGRGLLWKKIF